MHKLLIATTNPGKFEEISAILRPAHPKLTLLSLTDVKGIPAIEENGSSFLENAQKKAKIASTFSRIPCLADDSGLEIDALGGRPGIFSARFAGPNATDDQNVERVLERMKGIPADQRQARFRCAMVLCAPSGRMNTAVGDLVGQITETPTGMNGFGYDPIFFVPELGKTLAELPTSEKNRLSHRLRALEKISGMLPDFLKS